MYDRKNLARLKTLGQNAPEGMKAFEAFDKAAMAPGAIPVKYKELLALAVAFTTQCPYCIEIHAKKARTAGASEQEIFGNRDCGRSSARRGSHHARFSCHAIR